MHYCICTDDGRAASDIGVVPMQEVQRVQLSQAFNVHEPQATRLKRYLRKIWPTEHITQASPKLRTIYNYIRIKLSILISKIAPAALDLLAFLKRLSLKWFVAQTSPHHLESSAQPQSVLDYVADGL